MAEEVSFANVFPADGQFFSTNYGGDDMRFALFQRLCYNPVCTTIFCGAMDNSPGCTLACDDWGSGNPLVFSIGKFVEEIPLFLNLMDPPGVGHLGRGAPIMKTPAQKLLPMEQPATSLIKLIAESLRQEGIQLKYFGWMGMKWYAQVMTEEDGYRLPSRICGLVVAWEIFTLDVDQEHACRKNKPRLVTSGGLERFIIEGTCSSPNLRPGMMVESADGVATTSGVPLSGPGGDVVFTVAAHGFKSANNTVYHTFCIDGEKSIIGEVVDRNLSSDVAFVRLEPGLQYSCDFCGDTDLKLAGLGHSEDVAIFTPVTMDSPYNGHCDGSLIAKGVLELPEGFEQGAHYAQANMVYFANGGKELLEGSCGCPIYTEELKVVGFCKYYDAPKSVVYSSSADFLIEGGYQLQEIC